MKQFLRYFVLIAVIAAVSITAFSLIENRKISLGSLLPDDFTDVTALHIKNGTQIAAVGTLHHETLDPIKLYKQTLNYIKVKKYDTEIDGHFSDDYYIINLDDERLIIFDDDTVLVSKNGVYSKYVFVDHSLNLIGNRFVWR